MEVLREKKNSKLSGQLYREFSRKRFDEIREKFPAMRQSEVVVKVIQEWEALSPADKLALHQATPTRHLEIDPTKLPLRSTDSKPSAEHSQPNMGEGEKLEPKVLFDSPRSQKKIRKANSSRDYMAFFKHHYERVMREHPKWTANQATVIIKLLWRRRKLTTTAKPRPLRPARVFSARQAFSSAKRREGCSTPQVAAMWKHLPLETRHEWKQIGNPIAKPAEPAKVRSTMRLGASQQPQTQLSFLTRRME